MFPTLRKEAYLRFVFHIRLSCYSRVIQNNSVVVYFAYLLGRNNSGQPLAFCQRQLQLKRGNDTLDIGSNYLKV